jgi:cytochrome c553
VSTRATPIFLAAAALFAGQAASAQPLMPLTLTGDAARGQTLAYTCTGCHGVDSAVAVYPTYHVPKLGGQNADYLEVALQGYRTGARSHDTMHGQAAQLDDQDIADIAAYFASIEGKPAPGILSAGSEAIAAGQEKSAACQACHGADGFAMGPQWPNLAGQHHSYLVEAIRQYKNAERTDPVMAPLVSQLDEESIEQIAAFFAAQPGLFQTPR